MPKKISVIPAYAGIQIAWRCGNLGIADNKRRTM